MSPNLQWTIGEVRVTRVEESIITVPWSGLVPEGAELVAECQPWIDRFISTDRSQLLLSVHSFVVQTPETLLVVDTCVGDSGDFQHEGDPSFGDRLAGAIPGGLEAVDVVVCTHLHFDHVGWNTRGVDGHRVPRFTNARYLVTADELAAERDEEDGLAYSHSIEPLTDAGCLDAVAGNHRIDPWVSLEPSPGHTPGHVSLRITDGQAVGIITGDIAHSPLQLAHPQAAAKSDHDPGLATKTRRRYVSELINSDVLILGTHFGPPTAGHLISDPSGVRFE